MTGDILALSARYIDENLYEGPRSVNRTTTELSEIAEGIALVEAFSHVVAFASGDGLVLFDTSLRNFADAIRASLRRWRDERVHSIAFTHGHVDHVGGTRVFLDEARERGHDRPRLIGHDNVAARFRRYEMTNGYNAVINARQFSPTRLGRAGAIAEAGARPRFGPADWPYPDTSFADRLRVKVGDLTFDLRHARGETDDHLWAWVPERKAICSGDFVTWVFPNAGNPQKVQRYPLEWAKALREMAALQPELLLPAHGLPVAGQARIAAVLGNLATALETIVEQCLAMMNQGAALDSLIHEVRLPPALLEKPYLRPIYDEPEFVVRNVWRLYGGWYDGNPANLKPAPAAALAGEVAALAGGAGALAARARTLSEAGEHRLACHLVEMAAAAAADDKAVHGARAEIYAARREGELSLMAKGIFGTAAADSGRLTDDDT